MKVLFVFTNQNDTHFIEHEEPTLTRETFEARRQYFAKWHGVYINSVKNTDELDREMHEFFYYSNGAWRTQPTPGPLQFRRYDLILECGQL